MLYALDIFFTVFHTGFVVFVLVGWAHPKTRKAHISALLLTLIAWLLLGLYTGVIGYCPLTDWHWEIKRALGEGRLPASFTEYMAERITGINFSKILIDTFTALGLVFGIIMAYYYHRQEQIKNKSIEQHQAA